MWELLLPTNEAELQVVVVVVQLFEAKDTVSSLDSISIELASSSSIVNMIVFAAEASVGTWALFSLCNAFLI